MSSLIRCAIRQSLLLALLCGSTLLTAAEPMTSPESPETVLDRLWIWGHPAGVYNGSYLRPMKLVSTIEPVEAARRMGLANMIFLATPNVDVGLEAVEWTRRWIHATGSERLPSRQAGLSTAR